MPATQSSRNQVCIQVQVRHAFETNNNTDEWNYKCLTYGIFDLIHEDGSVPQCLAVVFPLADIF